MRNVRCKIEVVLVRDLFDEEGNIVPATDIIESSLLEEYETIRISDEQYDYLANIYQDGELHTLEELREDFGFIYARLSAPRIAYIHRMYEECNMGLRLSQRKHRIKAYVVPIITDNFDRRFRADSELVLENDIIYRHYGNGRKSVVLCLNKDIEVFESDADYIEDGTFRRCQYLKHISLPNVIEIGDEAFIGCVSLHEVHLSDHLSSIGNGAFMGCHFLDYIELPSSLTTIGDMAFCDCANLTHILNNYNGTLVSEKKLHPNVRYVGDNAFVDTPLECLSDNPIKDSLEENV